MSGENSNRGALLARIADGWAERDAARMRELDRLIGEGRRCEGCGTRLYVSSMQRHPGACSRCAKRGRLPGKTA